MPHTRQRFEISMWNNLLYCGLVLILLLWSLPVLAQPFPSPQQQKSRPFGEPGTGRCTEVSVEPQIVLNRRESSFERAERIVDFTITVFVTNQCQEQVQLSHGSFVAYHTNFPALVQELSQPPECLAQQRSFSGLVPPLQKVPFTFRVQGCTFPAAQMEGPRVTLETGRIAIDGGEKPIPSVTEVLP
ncbi:MAG: hypothetical protein ACRERD_11205 [Candidatus Binatia bacterium]